jgi:YadA head domain repeat (2 copies)
MPALRACFEMRPPGAPQHEGLLRALQVLEPGDVHALALGRADLRNRPDPSGGTNATAVGQNAKANANNATAYGNGANAAGVNATALGQNANALADNSSAVGNGATVAASHTNAAAFGAGATTPRANQQSFGTASNTYTMAGITSNASKAAPRTCS